MENVPPKGLIVFAEASEHVSAIPLLTATLKRLSQQSFEIAAVLNFSRQNKIQERFNNAGISSVTTLCLPDIEKIPQFFSEIPGKLSHLQKPLVFVENLNVYIEIIGIDATIRELMRLSAKFPVYTIVKVEGLDDLSKNRLDFVSAAVLNLKSDKSGRNLCETVIRKKDGSLKTTLEEYTIEPASFSIESKKYKPEKVNYIEVDAPETSAASQLPKTTFDMGLNLREDEAKAKKTTRLPYTNAQNEQGLVNLNITSGRKVRAGGQIIYTPDRDDDLDDSDPDDDLMI
uniref:Elongator complex protein 5 n=1 Tax=Bursaphelenchus xylophilus TaxID=6326 RepID=A0A1I7RXW2_BURXY